MVLRRVGPPLWLGFLATGWGVTMLCMGFVQNSTALAGCRFLLGCFEAGCIPPALDRRSDDIRLAWCGISHLLLVHSI